MWAPRSPAPDCTWAWMFLAANVVSIAAARSASHAVRVTRKDPCRWRGHASPAAGAVCVGDAGGRPAGVVRGPWAACRVAAHPKHTEQRRAEPRRNGVRADQPLRLGRHERRGPPRLTAANVTRARAPSLT